MAFLFFWQKELKEKKMTTISSNTFLDFNLIQFDVCDKVVVVSVPACSIGCR